MVAMEPEKKEGPVAAIVDFWNDDRSAERAADQVEAGQTGNRRGILPKAMRGGRIPITFFPETMQLVGSALVRNVHDPAAGMTVFSRQGGRENFDFADVLHDA